MTSCGTQRNPRATRNRHSMIAQKRALKAVLTQAPHAGFHGGIQDDTAAQANFDTKSLHGLWEESCRAIDFLSSTGGAFNRDEDARGTTAHRLRPPSRPLPRPLQIQEDLDVGGGADIALRRGNEAFAEKTRGRN